MYWEVGAGKCGQGAGVCIYRTSGINIGAFFFFFSNLHDTDK